MQFFLITPPYYASALYYISTQKLLPPSSDRYIQHRFIILYVYILHTAAAFVGFDGYIIDNAAQFL